MPVLDWIGKQAVAKHHRDVPYRLLEPVPELGCGDADSGNLIVQAVPRSRHAPGTSKHSTLLPRRKRQRATALTREYTERRWPALVRVVTDGCYPGDNDSCENAIRPITLGRKTDCSPDRRPRASVPPRS